MRAKTAAALLLTANALDLATSLSLHGADQVVPLPARPVWLSFAQCLLLPGFAYVLWRLLPAARRAWSQVPAPGWAKLTLSLVLGVQLLHVFFRTEHYPFSAVTMFSDYVPEAGPPVVYLRTFAVDGPDGPEPLSLLREGNPYFARYLHYDYKSGWLLGTFGTQDADSARNVAQLLTQHGAQNPRPAQIQLDLHTGATRVLPLDGSQR